MKAAICCEINGEEYEVLADGRDTLLELLRDRIGLTGTKEGCGNGNCGSCTVLLEGQPINACLVMAMEVAGLRITTIEGIAQGGALDVVQRALVEHGGTQCGFCTPGIILSAKALLERNARPNEDEIRAAIAGNLCRCTGYDKIVEAVQAASVAMETNS